MVSTIFFYELKHWLKKPSTYLYAIVFFTLALFLFVGNAGWFDGDTHTASTKLQRWVNSPFELNYFLSYFNKFFLFLLPAIVGAALYRDYSSEAYQLMYSFPMKKKDYVLGKLLSSMLMVIGIVLTVGIAFIIGEHFPDLNQAKLGKFRPWTYLELFSLVVIPNLLFCGVLVFSVVLRTRNMYYGFGVVIGLFLLQVVVQNAFDGQATLLALFDPLAQNTVDYYTRYWNLVEQNTMAIPVGKLLIYNRILWLGVAAIAFVLSYRAFYFHQTVKAWFSVAQKKRKTEAPILMEKRTLSFRPHFRFDVRQKVANIFYLSQSNLRFIMNNPMFYGLIAFGILAILFAVGRVTNGQEITILPATRVILSIPSFFFKAIIVLITFIYSGMLMQRDRITKMNQLVDTTAVSNAELLLSKLVAIAVVQFSLLSCILLVGVGIQVYNGFYQFEWGLYFFDLFVLSLLSLTVWNIVSFFTHGLFRNTYLSIFMLILLWLGSGSLNQIGIETRLLSFNQTAQLNYSDLNSYGEQLLSFFIIQGYWLFFSVFLMVGSFLLWRRGVVSTLRERFTLLQLRWNRKFVLTVMLSMSSMLVLGVKIYQEEQRDRNISTTTQQAELKQFKKSFGQYAGMNQPRISSLSLTLDLYPEENSFKSEGTYQLVNRSGIPIDTFIVRTGFEEISSFTLDRPYEIIQENDYFKSYVLKLTQELTPGDSLALSFSIQNKPNGIFERYSNVLKNGTFLQQDILPRVGYILDQEEKEPHMAGCSRNHASAEDSDFIQFEATLSTSSDQTLLAPGHLLKEWTEDTRNYFHYRTSVPMKYSLGFNSGRFESIKENYKGIDLEVHYYEGHDHNLSTMLSGLKSSLDYNTNNFGAYQHHQARIIEFPQTEGTFATTYANNIPMSEVRFIANSDTSGNKVDLSFYVSAHELTHQWWGSQLVPANAKGARMLSESITEYISLNIYRNHYGKAKAMNFLKKQRERYLTGRTKEHEKEPSLSYVGQDQLFLFYGKGSMAFNSLATYWGEENLNRALRLFLEQYKFKAAPYPTSLDLIAQLKDACPDSLDYLIHDWFETVSFYKTSIVDASVNPTKTGKFALEFTLNVEKTTEDSVPSLPLADYVEVEIQYSDGSSEIKQFKVEEQQNKLQIQVLQQPTRIVVDPNLLLLEKNIEDNVVLL